MSNKKVTVVIPARMGSSRFPGKPLKKILDLPMIEHVRRRALLCEHIDDVYVATCDQEIYDEVVRNGGKAVMTSDQHERCTERVEEAVQKIDTDIVVILQGDEPLFFPEVITQLIAPMLDDEKNIDCTNLLSVITKEEDVQDVDIVKTVLDRSNNVMYFSRSPIPYRRVEEKCSWYRQTGISAFTKSFLHKFSNLPPTPLEIVESVDFLRILEHRYPIYGVIYEQITVGVDQAHDIDIVEEILKTDDKQKKIYEEILSQ